MTKKVSIIIPAYNEEKRIEKTIHAYGTFFEQHHYVAVEFVIVLNGCTDNTLTVVTQLQSVYTNIIIIDLVDAGKGRAIKAGFVDALTRRNDFIGFVDADMATEPNYFYELIQNIDNYDAIIASRYMSGAQVYPPRPWIKRWGSRLIYEPLIRLLFGLQYCDFQCGAKLFTYAVIEKIAPQLTVQQWAFDIELLYLCKRYGFTVKEIPTTWYDQADSKLRIAGPGFRMLWSVIALRIHYLFQ